MRIAGTRAAARTRARRSAAAPSSGSPSPTCRASIASRVPASSLRCPWHGWEFDIRTGQSWFDPKRVRARAYKVTIEPGAELAKGPYVAETFAVKVEENYVVIEV